MISDASEPAGRARRPASFDDLARQEAVEVTSHCGCGVVPSMCLLLQGLQADPLQGKRKIGDQFSQMSGLSIENLRAQIGNGLAVEGHPIGEKPIHQDTQGPDIGVGAELLRIAHQLFGGHVMARSEHQPRKGQLLGVFDPSREAEIGHDGSTFWMDQDVRWFQVSMHDARFVCVTDPVEDAGQDLNPLFLILERMTYPSTNQTSTILVKLMEIAAENQPTIRLKGEILFIGFHENTV